MSENETYYDEVIAPKLLEIAQDMMARGLHFAAIVEYDKNQCASTITPGAYNSFAEMSLAATAIRASGNVDSLVLTLAKQCKSDGTPHSSIFLNQAGVDPDPNNR